MGTKTTTAIVGSLLLGALAVGLAWTLLRTGAPLAPQVVSSDPQAQAPSATRDPEASGPADATGAGLERESLVARAEPQPAERKARAKKAEREASGPFLSGRVVDASGGAVAGARVEVGRPQAAGFAASLMARGPADAVDAETGVDGRFAVSRAKLPGSELAVRVVARGRRVLDESCEPDADRGDAWLGTFVLEPAVVIAGRVIDAAGDPVAGASVRRAGEDDQSFFEQITARAIASTGAGDAGRTDADGRFELAHEEAGDYELVVEHEDHVEGRFTGRTPPAGSELVDLVLRLPPAAALAGVVRGFPGKARVYVSATPVAGGGSSEAPALEALLRTAGIGAQRRGELAADGSFTVRGLVPGERYELAAFESGGFPGVPASACSDSVVAVAGAERVELAWASGARVVFEVRDEASGEAIGEVVVLQRWSGEALGMPRLTRPETFVGGHVVLEDLRPDPAPGELELVVRAPGRLERKLERIEVPARGEVDLGIVHLRAAPRLRVRVIDARSGEPIAKARVRLRPDADADEDRDERAVEAFGVPPEVPTARTEADGWCELDACATRAATLEVSKTRYARVERRALAMPTEGTLEQVVELFVGGDLRVTVHDSAGRPVARALVEHRDAWGALDSRAANESGELELDHLLPGEHAFRASRAGESSWMEMTVRGGEPEDSGPPWTTVLVQDQVAGSLELVLPSLAALSGRVTAQGEPIAGATVLFRAHGVVSEREELLLGLSEELSALVAGGSAGPRVARTDEDGRFRLEELEPGSHELRVSRSEVGVPRSVPVELALGENQIEVELPGSVIEGRVVDERGAPVEGALVRIVEARAREEGSDDEQRLEATLGLFGSREARGLATGADGRFRIASVPPGERVVVEAKAKARVTARSGVLEVEEGATLRDVELVLRSGGSIRVRVRGAAAPFAFVGARFADESALRPAPAMAVVSGGEAVLRDLAPGNWRVSLDGDEEEGASEVVLVRAGEETFVELER